MPKEKGECPCSESQTEARIPVGGPMEISPEALELLRTATVPFEFKEIVREVTPDMGPASAQMEAASLSPQINIASIGAPAQEVPVTPWPEGIPLDRGDEAFYLTDLRLEVSGGAHMTPGLLKLAGCRLGQLMFCSDGDDEDEKAGDGEGEGKDDTGEQILWYGVTIQNGVPQPGADECMCTGATLNYNGKTHAPLKFPIDKRSPEPGSPLTEDQTGPISGKRMFSPGVWVLGNAFEYHSTLNGKPGCTSRQYYKEIRVEIDKRTGVCEPLVQKDKQGNDKVFAINGSGFGPDAGWQPDASKSGKETYKGDTGSGERTSASKTNVVYEGTEKVIHWIDAPLMELGPSLNTKKMIVDVLLLKSETTNKDGKYGWHCLSGHTFIGEFDMNLVRWKPMSPKDARTLLDRIVPAAGASADMQLIVSMLKTSPQEGGFQGKANPEFRDLGCYPF